MTKEEFTEQFVLSVISSTNPAVLEIRHTQEYIDWAIKTAHKTYDTIHGKTVVPHKLIDLAKEALNRLENGKYLVQNDDGSWVVFESRPVLNPRERMWCNQNEVVGEAVRFTRTESGVTRVTESISEMVGEAVKFLVTKAPNDYTKEFYLISDILNHD